MCILFLYTDSSTPNVTGRNVISVQNKSNKDKKTLGYKLILAANRDEMYSRPSKEAHFWGCNPDIIAGTDAEPGKEGGTWLGMTTTGKIGALLNMPPKPRVDKSKKLGRGFLVTDYLKTKLTGVEYGNQLKNRNAAKLYHSFNLLTIDICNPDKENGLAVSYFSNYSPWINLKMKVESAKNPQTNDDQPLLLDNHDYSNDHYQINLGSNGIHSFGNCPYNVPLLKLKDGEEKFTRLIQNHKNEEEEDEEQLVNGLLNILKCSYKHYPDPELMAIAEMRSEEFAQGLSSRYVNIPWKNYGSRTHTIILVDTENKVKYMEWTMKEPIVDSQNPQWVISKYEFMLETEESNESNENSPVNMKMPTKNPIVVVSA